MSIEEKVKREKDIMQNGQCLNDKKDLTGKFCEKPFTSFEPRESGDVALCCLGWLPKLVGNLNNNTVEEIFSSKETQEIRKSILDGSFKYCDHFTCPRIVGNSLTDKKDVTNPYHRQIIDGNLVQLSKPIYMQLNYDASCNLKCPSCRVDHHSIIAGPKYEAIMNVHKKIEKFVEDNPMHPLTLDVSGSGDPFGSKVFRDFLLNFDGEKYPYVKFHIHTNGVILTPKMWSMLHKIHKSIQNIYISVDAAQKSTYDMIRVGGKWDVLMENIKFLSGLPNLFIRLNMVVQDLNYKEMPDFTLMTKSFGGAVKEANFSMVTDWSVWDEETKLARTIWRTNHPQYSDFLEVLRNPILRDPIVNLTNLRTYYESANN